MLDAVKAMGYKYSTQGGHDRIHFRYDRAAREATDDQGRPGHRRHALQEQYKRGLITEEERYKEVVETWKETDDAADTGTSLPDWISTTTSS